MALSDNQKQKIQNIEIVQGSVALLGSIAGVIYSKRTGGGFWRGLGYWVLGGLITGIPAALIATPFKNKILTDGDSESKIDKNEDNVVKKQNNSVEDSMKNSKPNLTDWNELRLIALDAEKRSGQKNQYANLTRLTDDKLRAKYFENFQNISREELNAIKDFYSKYNKSMSDTFTKVTPAQKTLIQTGTGKIFGAIQ